MGEYKTVSIQNVSLSEDDWQFVTRCVNNLDTFVQVMENKLVCMNGKSTTKTKYSIDCGALLTEYDAFLLALDFYVGEQKSGVRIEEMD